MSWDGGTVSNPKKIFMKPCSDESFVYFVKPGKEAKPSKNGEIRNEHDMRPVVEMKGVAPKSASFPDIWSDLTNIALKDIEAYRAVLLLIYRVGFLCDHALDDEKHWRYRPTGDIQRCITELEREVGAETSLGSVEKMLRFVDMLGWQEDVKYQKRNSMGSERIGRINTCLTCIRIPTDSLESIVIYRDAIKAGEVKTSLVPLYNVMQQFMLSGVCPPSQKDIPNYLWPYVPETSKHIDGVVDKRPYTQTTF